VRDRRHASQPRVAVRILHRGVGHHAPPASRRPRAARPDGAVDCVLTFCRGHDVTLHGRPWTNTTNVRHPRRQIPRRPSTRCSRSSKAHHGSEEPRKETNPVGELRGISYVLVSRACLLGCPCCLAERFSAANRHPPPARRGVSAKLKTGGARRWPIPGIARARNRRCGRAALRWRCWTRLQDLKRRFPIRISTGSAGGHEQPWTRQAATSIVAAFAASCRKPST